MTRQPTEFDLDTDLEFIPLEETCSRCDGRGEIFHDGELDPEECHYCAGTGCLVLLP